eukprot:10338571-Lingulodinium_polyedra.AAC.1
MVWDALNVISQGLFEHALAELGLPHQHELSLQKYATSRFVYWLKRCLHRKHAALMRHQLGKGQGHLPSEEHRNGRLPLLPEHLQRVPPLLRLAEEGNDDHLSFLTNRSQHLIKVFMEMEPCDKGQELGIIAPCFLTVGRCQSAEAPHHAPQLCSIAAQSGSHPCIQLVWAPGSRVAMISSGHRCFENNAAGLRGTLGRVEHQVRARRGSRSSSSPVGLAEEGQEP